MTPAISGTRADRAVSAPDPMTCWWLRRRVLDHDAEDPGGPRCGLPPRPGRACGVDPNDLPGAVDQRTP